MRRDRRKRPRRGGRELDNRERGRRIRASPPCPPCEPPGSPCCASPGPEADVDADRGAAGPPWPVRPPLPGRHGPLRRPARYRSWRSR